MDYGSIALCGISGFLSDAQGSGGCLPCGLPVMVSFIDRRSSMVIEAGVSAPTILFLGRMRFVLGQALEFYALRGVFGCFRAAGEALNVRCVTK
jgi:hypothetical protein